MTSRTDDEAEVFGRLFVLGQHLSRRADDALRPLGLTSKQWLLLAVLVKGFPGSAPTLTEAAAAYGTSRQNVKQVALQLAERGLVELVADPQDGRATRLALLPRVAMLDEPAVAERHAGLLRDMFSVLDDAELATLTSMVGRCIDHLSGTAVAR